MKRYSDSDAHVLFDTDDYDEKFLRDMGARDIEPDAPDEELIEEYRHDDFLTITIALQAYFDGAKSEVSNYINPIGGNRLISMGSSGRWDGTSTGLDVSRDFSELLYGSGSSFKDCEIQKIWEDGAGRLYIDGAHHDGSVNIEVRQLTDAGEDAYEDLVYAGNDNTKAIKDLFINPKFTEVPSFSANKDKAHEAQALSLKEAVTEIVMGVSQDEVENDGHEGR